MVRGLANFDPERMRVVFRWPLEDALKAWRDRLRQECEEGYRFELLRWTIQSTFGKVSRPDPPVLLNQIRREINDGS